MESNNRLGRGLGSLIPNKIQAAASGTDQSLSVSEVKDRVLHIEVEKIKVNAKQPRRRFTDDSMDELADSVRAYGIIQPLIVAPQGGGFELIAGERRLRAAQKLKLEKVPVIVREANEQERLEVALIENIQREDLNPIELAHAYKRLLDEFSLTQEEVGKRVGKSRPLVTNTLRLLQLPEEIKLAVMEGKITHAHAKFIMGLDSEEKQLNLFRKIMRNQMNVTEAEKEARRMGGTKKARIKINYADKDKEFKLREFFSTKVEIRRKGRGGLIIIDFYSDEELAEMIDKIS